MKISRPSFTWTAVAILAGSLQAQSPPNVAGQGGGRPAAADPAASPDPEALVERVERNIDSLQSLSAKIRQQVEMFDHQVTGAGQYVQQGRGVRQLSRFELKSQVGDASYTLLKINDGHFFWTFRELPGGPTISRIDLDRVEAQLAPGGRSFPVAPLGQWELGGLSKMLAGLRQNFQFTAFLESRLGDRPVWIVDGQWRPAQLIATVPDQRGTIEAGRTIDIKKLPAHLPERVLLTIGQSDLMLYRIEYLRRAGKGESETRGGLLPGHRTIVATEFFDVRVNVPIDSREFVYQPSGLTQAKGLKVVDATDGFLKSLMPGTK
jgi:hypothetical protein